MTGGGAIQSGRDFFVSYTAVDLGWAEWVAWYLDEAGYTVRLQAWDFPAGSNWVREMDRGVRWSRHIVAIVSADYLTSVFATAEWQAAWRADPTGERRILLPVRVADCPMPGLLGQISAVDLFGVAEPVARDRLLSAARGAVSPVRAKPARAPRFPTARFPGRLWGVPELGDTAVARPANEAELLDALLDRGARAGAVTVLEGMGGFGKTTLAGQVCRRPEVQEAFHGGLLWVAVGGMDRDGPELAKAISGLCSQLSGQAVALSDPMAAGARLAELVAGLGPTLVVIDDVWSRQQLAPFVVVGRHCHLLVMTRNRGVTPPGGTSVIVDQMTREEATAVLCGHTRRVPAPLLDRLIALTGRWPVLLGIATECLAEYVADGADPAEAAAWLADRLEAGGPAALDAGNDAGRDRAVAATVDASLSWLDPEDQARYAELAIFPEGVDVPAGVLELLWGATGELDRTSVDRLRTALVRLHLVQGLWGRRQPAVRLHEVIRSYLRHREGQAAVQAGNRALVTAARTLAGSPPGTGPTPWWSLPQDDGYLASHLVYHLVEAGLAAEGAALVGDLRWVEATIRRTGSTLAAEADLDTVGGVQGEPLAGALGRIGHLLPGPGHPTALSSTLAARLHGVPGVEKAVRTYRVSLPRPRLEPAWPLPDQPQPVQLRVLTGHTGGVLGVVFSPCGQLAASVGDDATVRVWEVATGVKRAAFQTRAGRLFGVAFSPDGRLLAAAGDDEAVRVWEVATGAEHAALRGHAAWARGVAFSSDGRFLASACDDGTVRVWEVAGCTKAADLAGHVGEVYGVAFSPDGRLIASAGGDGTVRLWDVAGREEVAIFGRPPPFNAVVQRRAGEVYSVAFSPDGRLLAATDDATVRIWDMTTHKRVAVIAGHPGEVYSVAFSPDGRLLASAGDDNTVRLWEVATGTQVAVFTGHARPVNGCAFSPDGRLLASAGDDTTVRVWEAAAAKAAVRAGHPGEVWCCAFSPDGRLLAFGCDATVRVWDVEDQAQIAVLTGHRDTVRSVAFSPDGRLLASADDGAKAAVRIWDPATGTERTVLTSDAWRVRRCVFSPDGRSVFAVDRDATVREWDLVTGVERIACDGRAMPAKGLSFSPGGRLVAAGYGADLRVCEVATGTQVAVLTGRTRTARVRGTAFSPDGQFLASAADDGTVRVLSMAAGTEHTVLTGHTGPVRSVAFSLDSRLLAATGDGFVRVWDLATGAPIAELWTACALYTCTWHGNRLALAGDAGIYVLNYIP
jgi:WD40 repeat protein